MSPLFEQINAAAGVYYGFPATSDQIIRTQQELHLNNLPAIPEDYVEFLRHCNIVSFDGNSLYGINPNGYSGDILSENLNQHLPLSDILILGANDFDLLAYNAAQNIYQIIDKDDFKVLQTYQNLNEAGCCILKIDND